MSPGLKKRSTIVLITLGLFFLLRVIPVSAQEETPVTTDTVVQDTTIAPEATETEVQDTDQEQTPTDSVMETAGEVEETSSVSESGTVPTTEITATATPVFTFTPTATVQVKKTKTAADTSSLSCSTTDVYDYQIVVKHKRAAFPEVSFAYAIETEFEDADGYKISAIEVNRSDFCAALAELSSDDDVIYAEPNYSLSLTDTLPNDAYYSQQYYLNNILAPQGWDYTTGSSAVTIAIIDSGVDLNNPELSGKLTAGYDFVSDDSVPQDENGHGTFVAGVAAAASNNGTGVAGISWGAQIMPLRVLDQAGNGSYANAASAIIWAADHGALVINMSLGGSKYSEVLADAVDYASQKGIVMVAATGNTGAPTVLYPAALPGVIAVGATDSANQLAGFSNTGAGVDVVAPGVSIFGLGLQNTYVTSSGTSMSAPQVAGYAALLYSISGVVYSSQVEDIIESTAKDLGATGWDSQYGYGLIQIGTGIRSVIAAKATSTAKHEEEETATPTPTATVYSAGRYSAGTEVLQPFQPTADENGSTPTPGEIYMLETGNVSAQSTETPVVSQTEVVAESKTNIPSLFLDFVWIVLGVVCILGSITVYLFIHERNEANNE